MAANKSIHPSMRNGMYVDEAGNVLPVKRKSQDITASGTDTSILALIASTKLRVLQMVLVVGAGATTITFKSKPSGSSAAISPSFLMASGSSLIFGYNKDGWFETVAGEALTATTSSGATISVMFTYVEIPP